MDMFWKYVQGKDTALRSNIGVTDIYFRPVSVSPNTPDLPKQFEYVTLYFDLDVEVTAQLIEGCYDECGVNPIPLPDGSCPPINRVVSVTGLDTDNTDPSRPIVKISVDGTTITGEGTPDDPLVAIGGGGGGSLRVQDEGSTVTNAATSLNFTGNVTASLASAGNVTVNVPSPTPQVNADWNASSGVAEILNKPTIPNAQVNSDWNASSGVAEILNKPSIPAAQIQSDWNQANNAALDFIKNKPTIPSTSGLVPYTGATQDVDLGSNGLTTHDLTVSHPSGSGVAASITKGGSGEALTVVKSSGSGNAASITGGVTLISELHLTTDLADAYIASAATWNAKQDALSEGTGIDITGNVITNTAPDQTVVLNEGTGIDVTGTYPNFTIANTNPAPNRWVRTTDGTIVTGTTANTVTYTQEIAAGTFATGNVIRTMWRARKIGVGGTMSMRIYVNSTPDLSGSPLLIGVYTGLNGIYAAMERHAAIKSSSVTEIMATSFSFQTDLGVLTTIVSNINPDWTATRYIVFALQNTSAADQSFLSFSTIEQL
jgi:hypothetical protein